MMQVAYRSWRANRVALTVVALALLTGTPAILTAAGVRNPWALAVAIAAAAVIVAFGTVWQQRYQRLVEHRDELADRLRGKCLVMADGRLPAVSDITDPVRLGVHPAADRTAVTHDGPAVAGAPVYVPRDVDSELRETLAAGGFVLLVGDSTAGKSRTAFEAVSATLPGHMLICPSDRDVIAAAVDRAARERRCVLWLDGLEHYLGAGGLTAAQLGRLLSGEGHHRVVMATIRTAERARLTAVNPGDDAGHEASRDFRQVLDQAHQIRVSRMFTGDELERARARGWDPRIAEAIGHADSYGIAEYLAAGPELLSIWEDARASSEGHHARGAALVAAAIDIRRAGYTSPIPRALLGQVHKLYLADPEHARIKPESTDDAWAWAERQQRATTALLHPAGPELVEVFDYLVDVVQRRAGPLGQVPELVMLATLDYAGPDDADSLAYTAYAQNRYMLAEHGWRKACQAKAGDPAIGADHVSTMASHNNLAVVLRELGRLAEAETEHRAVLDARARVLGPDHPDTLASRGNLTLVLRDLGRLAEAETEHRAVLDARARVLGPDHPDTLNSRNSLANVLRARGRLEEAGTEYRAVLDAMTRVLGRDHPATLTARSNYALLLRAQGRLAEAEAEHRAVLDARIRAFGLDHPATLNSRSNLAVVLRDLGRLAEAEAEHRAVLDARIRVLGSDHPATLASHGNLALVLRDLGRLDEAEAEAERAVPPPGTIS
jgi:tetratricopeptide (TPR) repeat protein